LDIWKFFGVTHREHEICNPTSHDKLERLVKLLRLPRGARVVDIACGKAAFLVRMAESYGVRGIGIDISPYFVEEAEQLLKARAPDADITLLKMDGAEFKPQEPHGFACASCIGASWIFGGHAETLRALTELVEPGGWVVAGEAFWKREPSDDYLEASGDTRESFGTHAGNAEAGKEFGLELVHTLVSSNDDWDRYEGLQWYSTHDYARSNPDDPDLPELLERVEKQRRTYLHWGRDTLGWAIYLFRRNPS
jgi:SAM-dependent methyltransferase